MNGPQHCISRHAGHFTLIRQSGQGRLSRFDATNGQKTRHAGNAGTLAVIVKRHNSKDEDE